MQVVNRKPIANNLFPSTDFDVRVLENMLSDSSLDLGDLAKSQSPVRSFAVSTVHMLMTVGTKFHLTDTFMHFAPRSPSVSFLVLRCYC